MFCVFSSRPPCKIRQTICPKNPIFASLLWPSLIVIFFPYRCHPSASAILLLVVAADFFIQILLHPPLGWGFGTGCSYTTPPVVSSLTIADSCGILYDYTLYSTSKVWIPFRFWSGWFDCWHNTLILNK